MSETMQELFDTNTYLDENGQVHDEPAEPEEEDDE